MTHSRPSWLIAVDGAERGELRPLDPGHQPELGPAGWREQARANLFFALGGAPLEAGDLVEYESQMWLAATRLPGWPGQSEEELMAEEDTPWPSPPVEIPRVFHSVYHGAPFPSCLVCSAPLLEGEPRNYMIEKIYRGREVILECAVCQPCVLSTNCEISQESRERLEAFSLRLFDRPGGLQHCRLCGKPRPGMGGFNTISTALLDRVLPESWVLICQECLDQMDALLSKKTRDVYGEFVEDNFPGIPDDIDVPRPVFL